MFCEFTKLIFIIDRDWRMALTLLSCLMMSVRVNMKNWRKLVIDSVHLWSLTLHLKFGWLWKLEFKQVQVSGLIWNSNITVSVIRFFNLNDWQGLFHWLVLLRFHLLIALLSCVCALLVFGKGILLRLVFNESLLNVFLSGVFYQLRLTCSHSWFSKA